MVQGSNCLQASDILLCLFVLYLDMLSLRRPTVIWLLSDYKTAAENVPLNGCLVPLDAIVGLHRKQGMTRSKETHSVYSGGLDFEVVNRFLVRKNIQTCMGFHALYKTYIRMDE